MEMFELRYFYAVAEQESVLKAAAKLNVSSSSLSKAVSRLESEFGVRLFQKEGRHIKLTTKGIDLRKQCSRFFEIENEIKLSLSERAADFQISISGPEVFLSRFGVDLASKVKNDYRNATVAFADVDEWTAQTRVWSRQADLCIVSGSIDRHPDLTFKHVASSTFGTYVSNSHPLSQKGTIPVETVLSYDFVTPAEGLLAVPVNSASTDGWRDDKFRRRIAFKGTSLKTVETLLVEGLAVAYLPSYLIQGLPVKKLNISGCPYSCQQKIYFAARNPRAKQWLWRYWNGFE